jgi:diguanylate cyclase (GGDEF)-like protein/PAS domain S-box-containing protein
MSISTLEEGTFLEVNDRFVEFFGYSVHEMLGRTAIELGIWPDPAQRARMVEALLAGRAIRDWEVEVRRRGGERRTVHLSAELIELDGLLCVLAVTQDVTDARRLAGTLRATQEQLLRDAFRDPVATLPNRALFLDRLGRALARGRRRPDRLVAVLVVAADGLKGVGDQLGDAAGAAVLRAIATRLQGCVRSEDTVGRTCGDQLAVLVEEIGDGADVPAIAERLLGAFAESIDVEGHQVLVSASVGVALASGAGRLPGDVLRDAEIALHRARESL